jgi:polyisoprenoid-binding protein YceI
MRIYRFFVFMILAVLLNACGTLIQPKVKTGIVELKKGNYQLDKTHTSVLFKVNHMGLSTFVGRFNKVDASLEFDPHNISSAKLTATIDINSIDVNNPELSETLLGSSWFDAKRFPQAVFTTTSVSAVDANSAVFRGELHLHGVTAPIELALRFNGGANNMLTGYYTLGFSATTSFKRSTFGVDYLIPAVGDEISVEVFAEFQKRSSQE